MTDPRACGALFLRSIRSARCGAHLKTPPIRRLADQPWPSAHVRASLMEAPPPRILYRRFSAASKRSAPGFTDSVAEVSAQSKQESKDRWANTPAYEMTFTCKQCDTRSSHKISKQGYHYGTVLIACPGCKNRHLIADHMKVFSDKRITLEDIMKEKGQLIKRGTLSTDGDLEFWDDGSQVKR